MSKTISVALTQEQLELIQVWAHVDAQEWGHLDHDDTTRDRSELLAVVAAALESVRDRRG